MADISKIKLPGSSTVYEIKDQQARSSIENLPKGMVYKGTLGTGGTISTLPTATVSIVGHTYKVITNGTYNSQAARVGGLFICAETSTGVYSWVYAGISAVTSVTAGTGLSGGTITSTGTITLDTSYVSTTEHAGLSPALPSSEASDKYLCGDGSWKKVVVPGVNVATGIIAIGGTSATVNFSGTFINAYIVDGNNKLILSDTSIGESSVVFTVASAATESLTCKVVSLG